VVETVVVKDALEKIFGATWARYSALSILSEIGTPGDLHLVYNAMKDFSHINADEKVQADLNKAIESTLTVSRNAWKYVADLKTEFDENLPLVTCYLADINQVVMNLIINAVQR